MLSNIKAKVRKYWELSWPELCNLKAWLRCTASFRGSDVRCFSNPSSLRVVSVENATGETISFYPIETVFMATCFSINPKATNAELELANNQMGLALECEAQRIGASRMLIVIPDSKPTIEGEKWIRVLEQTIPQTTAIQGNHQASLSREAYQN